MAAIKRKYGAPEDLDLNVEHLKELAGEFLAIVERHCGKPFPQDPYEQLEIAIGAVFGSWMGKRAVITAGNSRSPRIRPAHGGERLHHGVRQHGQRFRHGRRLHAQPRHGREPDHGEYLVNAQGEDVVAGIRTPKAIAEMEQEMPEIYRQLMTLHNRLESHYHEVQDFEFTIEKNILYCLQRATAR